jgi:hypothetical protein
MLSGGVLLLAAAVCALLPLSAYHCLNADSREGRYPDADLRGVEVGLERRSRTDRRVRDPALPFVGEGHERRQRTRNFQCHSVMKSSV